MGDRAAFLASIEKPKAGFLGTWKNVQGEVTVKPAGPGKLEVGAELANRRRPVRSATSAES